DNSGNMTGIGTEFLKTLRGQPDHPTKIKFTNAVNNILEYEVLDVIDDFNAILNSVTTAETNLKYSIVGTFTPGVTIPSTDKYPIQYDECIGINPLTFVQEVAWDTPPVLTGEVDEAFYLARIKRIGSTITIEDKRINYVWETRSDYNITNLLKPLSSSIPVMGVEEIKFDYNVSTKDKNIVYIGWVFRSSNWIVDTSLNLVTLNSGSGGRYKNTSLFNDGDFNGWRLYVPDGTYYKIYQSVKSGTAINLYLETLDYSKFSTYASQELIITPNAEQIEFKFLPDPTEASEIPTQSFLFNINESIGKCPLLVYTETGCLYNVSFRFKQIGQYSEYRIIPSDTDNGFYAEANHTNKGVVINPTVFVPYTNHATNGFIPLVMSATAYSAFVLGDVPGVTVTNITSLTTQIDLEVGVARENQLLIAPTPISLTSNLIINLKSNSLNKNGNKFNICFVGNIVLNGNSILIYENYIAAPPSGTLISSITTTAELALRQSSLYDLIWMRFIHSGTGWFSVGEDNFKRIYDNYVKINAINSDFIDDSANYTAAYFDSAGGGAITLNSCNVRYKVIGKLMLVQYKFQITAAGGLGQVIYMKIPGGKSRNTSSDIRAFGEETKVSTQAPTTQINVSDTTYGADWIEIKEYPGLGNFPSSDMEIFGQLFINIQ
ncbi:MAG TPA: hypothetical protein PKY56_00005, partial [Candidatus Kapabacteria bacterium]|nr:hypothetical protein [Candidatus Kapabacteria bacterium]